MFHLSALFGAGLVLHQHIGVDTALALAGLGLVAGWLGAVVGIGGGVVIVPALVLAFGFDTKVAVSSSLVAVVATSVAASGSYAASGQLNMRLALTLEMATTVGGLVGGVVAVLITGTVLDGLFAVIMLVTAALVFRGRDEHGRTVALSPDAAPDAQRAHALAAQDSPPHALATRGAPGGAGADAVPAALGDRVGWEERGELAGAYHDQLLDSVVAYRAVRTWIGWTVSFGAGLLSGLLGVGGGFLKVPAMSLGMRVPLKVAAATSNFMIGVTAIASLFVYFARGYVLPFVAAPIAIGIALGAFAGAKSSSRVSSRVLGRMLAVVLVFVAAEMGLKAAGVTGA